MGDGVGEAGPPLDVYVSSFFSLILGYAIMFYVKAYLGSDMLGKIVTFRVERTLCAARPILCITDPCHCINEVSCCIMTIWAMILNVETNIECRITNFPKAQWDSGR